MYIAATLISETSLPIAHDVTGRSPRTYRVQAVLQNADPLRCELRDPAERFLTPQPFPELHHLRFPLLDLPLQLDVNQLLVLDFIEASI